MSLADSFYDVLLNCKDSKQLKDKEIWIALFDLASSSVANSRSLGAALFDFFRKFIHDCAKERVKMMADVGECDSYRDYLDKCDYVDASEFIEELEYLASLDNDVTEACFSALATQNRASAYEPIIMSLLNWYMTAERSYAKKVFK